MKKRILWALLTILLLVGMLSTTAFAAETEEITTPEELCEVQEPIQQTLESDNAQLRKLAAPTNVAWHKYYPYGCTGTDDYFTYNGMMSWIVGDPDYNQLSRVTVYKDDEEQYCTEWTYDTEWADRYYTDWDLSLSEIAWRGDGEYRFTVQAVGDGVTTADSDIVSSDTWTFTMPDTKIATPTNLTWDGTTAKWTEDDNAAGFVIEIFYSADDGAATSTKSLTSTQKYVQYYGESGDTNGIDETAGWSIYEPGYYYFKVYSVSNDITKNWHSDAALSPAYAYNLEDVEEGCLVTFTYEYPAGAEDETCTMYAQYTANGENVRAKSGDRIPENSSVSYQITDIAEGYRIKKVTMNGVDWTDGFVDGAYGGIGMKIDKDTTVHVVFEEVPDPLPSVTGVDIYFGYAEDGVVVKEVTFGDNYQTQRLTAVASLDIAGIPNYHVGYKWYYSLDGVEYKPVMSWGNRNDFWAGWSGHSNMEYDPPINFVTQENYYIKVLAVAKEYYSQSENVWSDPILINPTDEDAAPEAPAVSITNVSSTGKIKLSWKAVDGAAEYKVYRSTSKNGTYKRLTTVTGTSVTNNSAVAGTQYYYYVVAVDGNGAESEKSNIVTRTCDLPRPELKISVVASTGKLKLSWDAIDGAIKYEVHRSTDGGKNYKLLKTTTGTSLTNTSITAGNKYYYKVKAIHSNTAANSAFSSAKYGTCDLPRPELKISVVSSTGKLKLRWDAIDGAVKYEVHRSTDGGKTYKLLKTTTGTSLTNTSITAGNKYYYKVKAIHSNTAANSAYSSVKYGTCDLARPTAQVSLNSKGKPVVSWAKVDGAVKYTVYIYDAEGELVKTSSTTGLKLTHGSAVKGKTYSYRVVAVHSNTNANSAKSTAVSITSK